MSYNYYIAVASSFSVLLPLLLMVFSLHDQLQSPMRRALGILLLASGLSDAISYTLREMGQSNIVFINSYYIVQFLALSYIYSIIIPDKKWVYGGVILFTVFLGINILFIQSFTKFQGWMIFVEGIILLGYAGMSSLNFLQVAHLSITLLDRLAGWINLAVIFYFIPNLFLFLIRELMFPELDTDTARTYWSFHNCVNILKNILLALGIYYTTYTRLRRLKIFTYVMGRVSDDMAGQIPKQMAELDTITPDEWREWEQWKEERRKLLNQTKNIITGDSDRNYRKN